MKAKAEPAAALYRCSDPKQENSIDRQRLLVEPYAARRNYDLVAEYVFDGVPGDEISRHPDWKRFLKDAKDGKFRVVCAEDNKRLNRDDWIDYAANVAKPFRDLGLTFDTVKNGVVDPTTLQGGIMAVVNAHESSREARDISQRVISTQAKLAQEGKAFAKKANYGLRKVYDDDPKTGKRRPVGWTRGEEVEAKAVEWMYDWIGNKRWSLAAVEDELDRRGIPPPVKGRRPNKRDKPRWNRRTIHSIIKNPIYKGDLLWNARHRGKYHAWRGGTAGELAAHDTLNRRETENRPEDRIYKCGQYEAIVPADLWTRANAALPLKKKRTGGKRLRANYLLSGMLLCGDCGSEMCGVNDRAGKCYGCSEYHNYGAKACCRNLVQEKQLLGIIREQLLTVILNPARLVAFEEECKRLLAAERTEDNLRPLRDRIVELERDLPAVTRNLAVAAPEDYADIKKVRDEMKTELLAKKDKLADLETDGGPQQRILAEARRQLNRYLEGLSSEDEELQAVVISEVISKAVVCFRHEQTHGKRSKTGKGRTLSILARMKLCVRPGLGVSEVFTTARR